MTNTHEAEESGDAKPTAASRALAIIAAVARHSEPITVQQIAAETKIGRATAYRTVDELWARGWLGAVDSPKKFFASLALQELAIAALRSNTVREALLPCAIELAQTKMKVTGLTFYDQGEAFFTDTVLIVGERVVPTLTGIRRPPTTQASGRVLLAFQDHEEQERVLQQPIPKFTDRTVTDAAVLRGELDLVNERGYSFVDGEFRLRHAGLAVPVFDRSGRVVASLGLFTRSPVPDDFIEQHLDAMVFAALRASRELGYRGAGAGMP